VQEDKLTLYAAFNTAVSSVFCGYAMLHFFHN